MPCARPHHYGGPAAGRTCSDRERCEGGLAPHRPLVDEARRGAEKERRRRGLSGLKFPPRGQFAAAMASLLLALALLAGSAAARQFGYTGTEGIRGAPTTAPRPGAFPPTHPTPPPQRRLTFERVSARGPPPARTLLTLQRTASRPSWLSATCRRVRPTRSGALSARAACHRWQRGPTTCAASRSIRGRATSTL